MLKLITIILLFFLVATSVLGSFHHYTLLLLDNNEAYGHLTETPGSQSNVESKNIGSYVVLFQRIAPTTTSSTQGGDGNSTLLRFSVMQNNQDTYGIFAALIIKEKISGNISAQFPYRLYEFGDIDYRYTFQNAALPHEVILQARIPGDPQYQNNALVANFDVPGIIGGSLGMLVQIVVIVAVIALAGGMAVLVLDFNKKMKGRPSSS
ncbi:MAG: hypothetical protein ACJ70T_05640 [Nitrososphaera sp.]